MEESVDYPLKQLVIIKQRKLEEAEKILHEKKRLLLKEQEKLRQVEQERDKVKEHKVAKLTQFREVLDAGTTSDKIQQMKHYLKVVDEQLKSKEAKVKEQMKHVEAAEKHVEAARKDFLKKQQDVEKLELHKEDWKKQMLQFMEKKEAEVTDEMGSTMHTLRKKRSAQTKKKEC